MTSRNRRRRFPIVDRSLQYRLLAMTLIYSAIIIAFLASFLFVPDAIKMQDESLSLEVRAAAADRILTLHGRVWPAAIAIICIIGLHSFRAFLRVVGPLYRFRWALEEVRRGNLGFRVKLRDKDYLRREEGEFNEMIRVLSEKLRDIQLSGRHAVNSLADLEQMVTRALDLTETDRKLLHAHRHHLDTLLDAAQYFQVQESEQGV